VASLHVTFLCVWIDCHTFPHIHTIAYLYVWSVVGKYLRGASVGTENVTSLLLVTEWTNRNCWFWCENVFILPWSFYTFRAGNSFSWETSKGQNMQWNSPMTSLVTKFSIQRPQNEKAPNSPISLRYTPPFE